MKPTAVLRTRHAVNVLNNSMTERKLCKEVDEIKMRKCGTDKQKYWQQTFEDSFSAAIYAVSKCETEDAL